MKLLVAIKGASKKPVGQSTYGRLIASLLGFTLLIAFFGYIAREVEEGETLTRDKDILLAINAHSSSFLDTAMLFVTYSGNILTVLSVTVVAMLYLVWAKRYRTIIQTLFTLGGAAVANTLLKLIFQRERPELWQLLTHESTYSFPSGHALLTATVATLVSLLFWQTKYRWYVLAVATMYTAIVGISRLYLGVHYPTDVLAGWLLGVAWALFVAAIMGMVLIKKDLLQKHVK